MQQYAPLLIVTAFLGALVTASPLAAADQKPVDFNRDVRPILSKKCFPCHGPDAGSREGGLRLDLRDAALGEADSGQRAIVPGNAASSELIARIAADDDSLRMPPAETGDPLTKSQIDLLHRWINQDAPYARHWAFVKPTRPQPPKVTNSNWPLNTIDHFVLNRLEQADLAPSPQVDRYALIRRLSFDLRGLPPTPTEVDAFINDKNPQAYENLVDAFLQDPAYGERWAQMWLDLARYADSKGYGSDPLREIWRYRDWVIDAFNNNMPYDQFTIEQIAGDLLPEATLEQQMATAFHRNTMTNTEGGTDDEEFRVAAVRDRVDTTMQVWMGLTMRCATCHDHKYDPIAQKEYYQFYAFFNQTSDNDQPNESPTIPAPTAEIAAENQRLDAEIAKARAQLETPEIAAAQTTWETNLQNSGAWFVITPQNIESTNGTTFQSLPDGTLLAGGDSPETETYTITTQTSLRNVSAVRLEVIPDPTLPEAGSGRGEGGNFVLSQFALKVDDVDQPWKRAAADFSATNFSVQAASTAKDLKKQGWSVDSQQQLPHAAVFILKEPLPQTSDEATTLTFRIEHQNEKPRQTLGRFRIAITNDPAAAQRLELPAEILAIIETPSTARDAAQSQKLHKYFRENAPSLKPLRDKIATLQAAKPAIPTLPVMQELPVEKHRTTHLMVKGNFLTHGEELTPALPVAFHPAAPKMPATRLGVAQWLVDPENPLTARVAVNRYWARLFGRGIVTTEEDFGTQGAPPSHPQLLDWLATEYVRLGWDTKAILKQMVLSATYQQSAQVTPQLLEHDPNNVLLSRGPRFRLKAEMVRDQALALSGLLSRKIHGPSVFPPQPPGLWRAAFNGRDRKWATSTGEDKYRRGLYTFWRRSVPYPSMATFDAPSREVCAMRRIRTNTPLQAFVTLNDPVYVEAAQALARRIFQEGGNTTDQRVRFALRLCLVRPPAAAQVDALTELFTTELTHYQQNKTAAVELATIPLGDLPDGMPSADLAAWTVVANVLLNLDAVLSKN
ncbi:PSD1 and planctomycete cytochrome C domain-containing protein [Symmachiella dynata]|uniref:PSD1 and planctomycete cytochrome C domain-containing protein n=1 Tax=Symmachiella dynata TaxID=2527995 RepID=UPI0030EEBD87